MFVYGFAKSDMDNISQENLQNLREMAAKWFATSDAVMARAIEDGDVEEITHAKEN